MKDETEEIRAAFERGARAMTRRPSIGQGTGVSRARLRDGLTCEVEDGPWKLVVDLAKSAGGREAGPTPGVYGRAALGGCLAIGYAVWAARLGVPLSALEVEVQADYDARAQYGVVDDLPPGYTEVRYTVTIESEAPEADLLRVLDAADAHSPYLDVFARPQQMRRELRITRPGGE